MKQGTKRGQSWCSNCDKVLVPFGTKCPICKVRNDKRVIKVNIKKLIEDEQTN